MPKSNKGPKPWRYATFVARADRARCHCVSCDEPSPSVMCETVHGVCVAFYYYCPTHWYAPAADGGPSAARRTGVDVPVADMLELLETAQRDLARTRIELAAACHELGHHVHCGPDCQGDEP